MDEYSVTQVFQVDDPEEYVTSLVVQPVCPSDSDEVGRTVDAGEEVEVDVISILVVVWIVTTTVVVIVATGNGSVWSPEYASTAVSKKLPLTG